MRLPCQIIAEQLEHETEQERVHIHAFYNIGYKTQSPVFEFSSQEALHWLQKCLCQEHGGFHRNLKRHQHLLNESRHFTSKLDYLWPVNREMRLMASGGSIIKAIAQNKKAFQQFAKSI